MAFKLSRRSLDRLEGVDDRMVAVVKHAITATNTDFGVIQGLRTVEQQKELVAKGASQTMKSKHLEGLAVDLMAYINGRGSWELNLYDDLADAMKEGANFVGCKIRWGAAWHIDNIGEYEGWRVLVTRFVEGEVATPASEKLYLIGKALAKLHQLPLSKKDAPFFIPKSRWHPQELLKTP